MSLSGFKLRHHAYFLFILCCLYLFSGLALDSAMALDTTDITGEDGETPDMGPGMQGNGRLPQTHNNALSIGLSPEVMCNKAQSGDVIATITAEGKPVAGETVYFFLAADEADSTGALFLPEFGDPDYLRSHCTMQMSGSVANAVDFGRFKAIVTDANGRASFNFIRDNYINYGGLGKALMERGSVKYYVVACVFEEPLEETRQTGMAPKIKYYAIAPVEITPGAAIVDYSAL